MWPPRRYQSRLRAAAAESWASNIHGLCKHFRVVEIGTLAEIDGGSDISWLLLSNHSKAMPTWPKLLQSCSWFHLFRLRKPKERKHHRQPQAAMQLYKHTSTLIYSIHDNEMETNGNQWKESGVRRVPLSSSQTKHVRRNQSRKLVTTAASAQVSQTQVLHLKSSYANRANRITAYHSISQHQNKLHRDGRQKGSATSRCGSHSCHYICTDLHKTHRLSRPTQLCKMLWITGTRTPLATPLTSFLLSGLCSQSIANHHQNKKRSGKTTWVS